MVKFISEIKIINNELIIVLNDKKFLLIVLKFLKNHFKFQFKEMIDICTVDYINNLNRFHINYNLLSLKYKIRLRLKLKIKEKENIITTTTNLFSSSN